LKPEYEAKKVTLLIGKVQSKDVILENKIINKEKMFVIFTNQR
jgi:hypothetical protein